MLLFISLKKPTSIALLLIIAIATLFPFAYLKMEKKAIRKSIKHKIIAGIDKNELVLLVFKKEEVDKKVKWKHSKEFQYNGEMYDIVETEFKNDSVYYWVWWDKEETALNQKVANLVRQNFAQNPYQNNKNQVVTHFFKTLYFTNTQWQYKIAFGVEIKHVTPYLENFSFWQSSPPSPPPQIG
ncbi:MAG: hypothetical protein K0B10_13405 [Vicingaceae bacterium]|nr:hypothetical protein [Vicingaceae bacterium]